MIDKIANPGAALSAYGNAAKFAGQDNSAVGGVAFGDMLKNATEASINTMKAGEKASAEAVTGKADLNDVVQAVTSAELTLQTVVAIRDRLVNAFQEIIRMPV